MTRAIHWYQPARDPGDLDFESYGFRVSASRADSADLVLQDEALAIQWSLLQWLRLWRNEGFAPAAALTLVCTGPYDTADAPKTPRSGKGKFGPPDAGALVGAGKQRSNMTDLGVREDLQNGTIASGAKIRSEGNSNRNRTFSRTTASLSVNQKPTDPWTQQHVNVDPDYAYDFIPPSRISARTPFLYTTLKTSSPIAISPSSSRYVLIHLRLSFFPSGPLIHHSRCVQD